MKKGLVHSLGRQVTISGENVRVSTATSIRDAQSLLPASKHGTHVVQLYSNDNFLTDTICRFVGDALATDNGALVIATQSHQGILHKKLAARPIDPGIAATQGRYLALDASETLAKFMVNGSVDAARFNDIVGAALEKVRKAAGPDCRIAVFGELVALLWAEGKSEQAIEVEHLWNCLAEKYEFSLLCAYPIAGFNSQAHVGPFLTMCNQHTGVLPGASNLALNSDEERLRTIAELQQKSEALEKALAVRQSEEQFRLLVEVVQDYAIFMLSPSGNVGSWNRGAERIKRYKAEEIIGKHFSCFYPEEDIRSGKPAMELEVAAKEGKFEDEGWRIRKDGTKFWANVIITAVRDGSGKLIGFAKVTRDFTERMEAQQALKREIAERREAQQQLHTSEKSLRKLSLHLLRSQDEERRRIGRDLHDSLGQYLAVLKMKLDSLAAEIGHDGKAAKQDVDECISLTKECLREVRTVSYLLYPPMLEEMGLTSAIPWYLDGFSARSGIKTTFDAVADFGRLPRDSELALFRVLQESLTNVHRHSGSRVAHVRLLKRKGMHVLEVEDEGSGISPQLLEQFRHDFLVSPGVGVRGMNERMRQLNGKLDLTSTKNGTMVCAMVPSE
jgi:PAS domain S-box-containing protein